MLPPIAKPTPPQLNDDRYFVVRNRTLRTDDPTGKDKDQNLHGVLANDGLPAGKPYEIERVKEPKFGKLVLNRDGTFTYTTTAQPGGDLVRADTFKYRVSRLRSRSLERAGGGDHCDSPLLR